MGGWGCREDYGMRLFHQFFGLLALSFTTLSVQARQNTTSYNDKFNVILWAKVKFYIAHLDLKAEI